MSGRELESANEPDHLALWRAQGADKVDPIRFHFIEAMRRRAADQQGTARHLLEERLAGLIAGYAARLQECAPHAMEQARSTQPLPTAAQRRGPVGRLNDRAGVQGVIARASTPSKDASGTDAGSVLQTLLPTLPKLQALDDFKRLWTQVHTDSKLRQSLEEAPENAGPLNSGQLVFRTLTLMSEISPGYLQQFLLYADTLAWMQQLANSGERPDTETGSRPAPAKRRSRKSKT